MKIKIRNNLFQELGDILATGNIENQEKAPEVSENLFAPNLYKIANQDTRKQYIIQYIKKLSNAYLDGQNTSTCQRLIKKLRKESEKHEKMPEVTKAITTTRALFKSTLTKKDINPISSTIDFKSFSDGVDKVKAPGKTSDLGTEAHEIKPIAEKDINPISSTSYGKYPEAECNILDLEKFAKNEDLLDKLFKTCRTDASEVDPELINKIKKGKAQKPDNHSTFAYVDNRIGKLNASHVQVKYNTNFILAANPRDEIDEIQDHLYHTFIASDCSLWFTLNECQDRPKFWTTEYLTRLKLPENWTISNIQQETVAEKIIEDNEGSTDKKVANPKLIKSTLIADNGQVKKTIIHYHYDNWLNHKPAPCEKILLECAKIATKHLQETGTPVGINCKGGVGRTGDLATIVYGMQHFLEELKNKKQLKDISINPAELNYDLRKERKGMISHTPQFIQVWKVLDAYVKEVQKTQES